MRKILASLGVIGAVGAATFVSGDARACGGCFTPPSESTVVTGHRMAFSVSPVQTVLWDQIQYAGDPAEFSWVLPVKRGAFIQIAADAFFDVLDPTTAITVQSPPEGCAPPSQSGGGFGCGSDDATGFRALADNEGSGTGGYNSNGVQVLHEGAVGPYDTVTLSSENPSALVQWLETNGYEIPDSIVPVIEDYVADDFDFLALKLQPGQGVRQMKPVRIVTPGSGPVLPLRMVAAGVGAKVDLVLFVIGEGRYQAQGFDNAVIAPDLVSWDFKTDRSSYAELRLATLGEKGSRTWLTAYDQRGPLLSPVTDPLGFGGTVNYTIGDPNQPPYGVFASTIAGAYVHQGVLNGEAGEGVVAEECVPRIEGFASVLDVVTNPCDSEGNCRMSDPSALDYKKLTCGALDDIGVALVGLHPADVHVTRLEASLPVEALDADLVVEAADDQAAVANRFVAGIKLNACWDQQAAGSVVLPRSTPRMPPGTLVLLTLGAFGLHLGARRLRLARTV
jgi:uncharacterized protein DUF2330